MRWGSRAQLRTRAYCNATEERFHGNAFRTFKAYDTGMGRLTSIQTGTTATPKAIQDLEYAWRSNGSLHRRTDRRGTTSTGDDTADTFSYDALERVTQQATTGGASRTLTFGYDLHGNIVSKTSSVSGDQNASGYAYDVTGTPHRLASVAIDGVTHTLSYDANGNTTVYTPTSGPGTFLKYDPQNNVVQITVGTSAETATPQAAAQRELANRGIFDRATERVRVRVRR
jgi:YD repeat-containing protein